jgi:hypothetical protein
MAIDKNLKGTSYKIPEVSDENYGEDLTSILVDMFDILNSTSSTLDINTKNFNFDNNKGLAAPITGFLFSTSNISRFDATYIITRDNGSDKVTESGTLTGVQGATGWELSREATESDVNNTNFPSSDGDIGVDFTITSGGQIQYTSNNYPSQTFGIITFNAKALEQ